MPRADAEVVYRFSELSDEAKDRVRARHMEGGWDRGWDYLDSLKALAEHFGGGLRDWDIDWSGGSRSSVKFRMPEIHELVDDSEAEDEDGDVDEEKLEALHRAEIQRRLDELGGGCKLTGMSYDDDAVDGFRKAFVEGESDLDALMHAAFHELHRAVRADYEYEFSDEGIAECCREDWFDEDGDRADPPDPGKGRYSKSAQVRAEAATTPHGRCFAGTCVEHAADRRVPRCALGRQPRRMRR